MLAFAKVLYYVGLTVVALFVFFGIDDILGDAYYYLFSRKRVKGRVSITDLDNVPARLLAIMIPAWNEAEVISQIVEESVPFRIRATTSPACVHWGVPKRPCNARSCGGSWCEAPECAPCLE